MEMKDMPLEMLLNATNNSTRIFDGDTAQLPPVGEKNILCNIKTFRNWKGDMDDYLQVGDLVDKEIVDHFLGTVPPVTHTNTIIQAGEAVRGETYSTLVKTEEGWRYAGICFKGETIEVFSK